MYMHYQKNIQIAREKFKVEHPTIPIYSAEGLIDIYCYSSILEKPIALVTLLSSLISILGLYVRTWYFSFL